MGFWLEIVKESEGTDTSTLQQGTFQTYTALLVCVVSKHIQIGFGGTFVFHECLAVEGCAKAIAHRVANPRFQKYARDGFDE